MSSVFRGMGQGSKKTPMIIAVCSTIIACALGIALFTKSSGDYMTEDQVMELLASNYADNMTEDQIRTILKTVTSKVETDYSDLDLSSLLTKDNAAWLKTYISREVADATKGNNLSQDKIKEITDLVVKQIEENQRQSLDEMAGKDERMTSEINSVKKEIEEFQRVKSQLETLIKDSQDSSGNSVAKESDARKKQISQLESTIKTLKELVEKNKSSASSDLSSKVKELESLIAKYKSQSDSESKSSVSNLLSQLNDTNNKLNDEIKKKNQELQDLIDRKNKEIEETVANNQKATDATIQRNKELNDAQLQETINNFNKDVTNITNNINQQMAPYRQGIAQAWDKNKSYSKFDIFLYTGEDDTSGQYGKAYDPLFDANNVIVSSKDTQTGMKKNHLYQLMSTESHGTNSRGTFLDITACDKIAQIEKKNVTYETQDNGDGTYLLFITGAIPNIIPNTSGNNGG